MFRIIADIADAELGAGTDEPARGQGPDRPHAHHQHPGALQPPGRGDALQGQLKDTNKFVRQAVLNALAGFEGNVDVALLCEVLRDPDVETQQKAIDAVVRANHPETMQHLVTVLRDEDENARRAAVEVLNEIGTPQHVKHLLQSIKDDDWWVRSRAADALAKIGGPRVIDAALELIRDQDEDVRRAAIEILNQTKDERAVGYLIEATRDKDWWVRERAVDALAEIGSQRAHARAARACCARRRRARCRRSRARSASSATRRSIPRLLPLLESAVEGSAPRGRSRRSRGSSTTARPTPCAHGSRPSAPRRPTRPCSHAALRAVEDLDARFSSRAVATRSRARHAWPSPRGRCWSSAPTSTASRARRRRDAQRLDISDAQAGRRARGPLQVHRRRSARAPSAPCC